MNKRLNKSLDLGVENSSLAEEIIPRAQLERIIVLTVSVIRCTFSWDRKDSFRGVACIFRGHAIAEIFLLVVVENVEYI